MTTPDEAQALLPVTQADRNLFKLIITGMVGPTKHNAIDGGCFDTDERMQAIARHRISETQAEALSEMSRLHSEIMKLHLECGSCSKWYTAQCPYETRLSGGKEGPSIEAEATRCRQFDLSDSVAGVIRRKEERIAGLQLAALTPSALSPEPVQKVHELPEGHRWCRHCEQKDPHCSVCEGVGYLPNTDPSARSGDAATGALAWLEQNEHCQLSHGPDFDDDSPEWQIHAVNGGRSDREWKLIGSGATIVEAINAARAKEAAR